MGSVLSLSPIIFLSEEDLKIFFEKTFPGLIKYQTDNEKFPGSFYVYFEWKKEMIELGLNKSKGVYVFDKKLNSFIQLLIRKQLKINELEKEKY